MHGTPYCKVGEKGGNGLLSNFGIAVHVGACYIVTTSLAHMVFVWKNFNESQGAIIYFDSSSKQYCKAIREMD